MHTPVLIIWLVGAIATGQYFLRVLKVANVTVTGAESYEQRVRVVMAVITVVFVMIWPLTAVLFLALRLMRRPT